MRRFKKMTLEEQKEQKEQNGVERVGRVCAACIRSYGNRGKL